jgi:PIN domain nuclease of toxin-antitoxin system
VTRYLLDTHVWLWLLAAPERVDDDVRSQLEDRANELFLSAASSWEIAIKYELGKLQLPSPPSVFVPERMRVSGVTAMPVEHAHALRVASLPRHHRDPFDRLLVAQADISGITLVTADEQLTEYDVPMLVVARP